MKWIVKLQNLDRIQVKNHLQKTKINDFIIMENYRVQIENRHQEKVLRICIQLFL